MSASDNTFIGPYKSLRVLETAAFVANELKFLLKALLTDGFVRVYGTPVLEFPCGTVFILCSGPVKRYCKSTE